LRRFVQNLWIRGLRILIWTICLVNFNLRRSCKVGLRRMCCRCEFIMEIWLSVAKLGDCSKNSSRVKFFRFLAWSFADFFDK
jgi:hypothetical protein